MKNENGLIIQRFPLKSSKMKEFKISLEVPNFDGALSSLTSGFSTFDIRRINYILPSTSLFPISFPRPQLTNEVTLRAWNIPRVDIALLMSFTAGYGHCDLGIIYFRWFRERRPMAAVPKGINWGKRYETVIFVRPEQAYELYSDLDFLKNWETCQGRSQGGFKEFNPTWSGILERVFVFYD